MSNEQQYTKSNVTTTGDSNRADPTPPSVLELGDVSKSYRSETAVDGISLSVRDGELLTLLGPSGCGKTTTLRLIAGLERPTAGTVRVDDETVADERQFLAPENRDIGLVFQNFALFPHLTVAENIAFGLTDASEDQRHERIADLLDLVSLAGYADRTPDQLSGGQKQRVALARSLAPEPAVLLLDEPFSNLDIRLRTEMREEVRRILKKAGVTAISVTHDQEEALSMSDRVAVMHDGCIEQIGRPEVVFEHPESRFVAEFLGQAGFVSGRFEDGTIETGIGRLTGSMLNGLSDEYDGARLDVLVRPDDLKAVPTEGIGDGTIINRQYTGPSFVYEVELDTGEIVHCQHNHATEFSLDNRVNVDLTADHTLAWYPAE
ncbi:ABC transporter ATP-binding protein [Haladaptatus sp. DFWS20]|uniref:ABC transporter ATP-binding protein n=1 Tax=Haladaptatus sp. DFWS20 TaxID=3403467 RepID=UPI003EC0FFB3